MRLWYASGALFAEEAQQGIAESQIERKPRERMDELEHGEQCVFHR